MKSSRLSSSVDAQEVARFSDQAHDWWNPSGAFRMLHELMPLRVAYVKEQVGAKRLCGLSVLDVGCGGGLMAEALACEGAKVTAIDASAAAIKVAQDHAAQGDLAIDYRVSTAEALAQEGKSYDVIVAFEIVEHVANLKSFMKALAALLKPEGVLLIATMNRTKRSFLLGVVAAEYVLGWVPAGTHDWDKFVKPSEMAALWQSLGLTATDVTGLVFQPFSRSFTFAKGQTAINYFMAGQKG